MIIMLSFQVKQFPDSIFKEYYIRSGARGVFDRIFRIVEHSGTQTHTSVVSLENVIIDASLTTLPEFFVIGKFGKCYRLIAHTRIEFHHRQRCRDTENFGEGKTHPRQLKSLFFYFCREAEMTVFRIHDQTGCRDKITMPPAFDVAETDESVAVERHNGFASLDFCRNIFI